MVSRFKDLIRKKTMVTRLGTRACRFTSVSPVLMSSLNTKTLRNKINNIYLINLQNCVLTLGRSCVFSIPNASVVTCFVTWFYARGLTHARGLTPCYTPRILLIPGNYWIILKHCQNCVNYTTQTIINHGYCFLYIGSNLSVNHYKKRADCVNMV